MSKKGAEVGFVELEQKGGGLLPVFTDLKNSENVEAAVAEWLSQPGPGGDVFEMIGDSL